MNILLRSFPSFTLSEVLPHLAWLHTDPLLFWQNIRSLVSRLGKTKGLWIGYMLQGWTVSPSIFLCWSCNPRYLTMWLHWEVSSFRRLNNWKWGHSCVWSLIQYDWCACHQKEAMRGTDTQGEDHVRMASYEPRKEASEETTTLLTHWSWTSSL